MDKKLSRIETWLIPLIKSHTRIHPSRPLILGLSGVQGSGKSTIVTSIQDLLIAKGYKTAQFSLDDLYMTHADQCALAAANKSNELLQSRGQFGTHDLTLARRIFSELLENKPGKLSLPSYDKSVHHGRGDRADEKDWKPVELPLQCVIFEGWGVGFKELSDSEVRLKHSDQSTKASRHALEHLQAMNDSLREYNQIMPLDGLIVFVPQQLDFVYEWRQQQERELRQRTGRGMSEQEVSAFVDRYYPSYELYLENTVNGGHNQLNLYLDVNRNLI